MQIAFPNIDDVGAARNFERGAPNYLRWNSAVPISKPAA
jgi:hypothetical protein